MYHPSPCMNDEILLSVSTTELGERTLAFTHLQGCFCSNMGMKTNGQRRLGRLVWPSGFSCKEQLFWCATYKTSFFQPRIWEGNPQTGPHVHPASRKFLIQPSRTSRDLMHLFHWHNMTEAGKRGPLMTPAPPLKNLLKQLMVLPK